MFMAEKTLSYNSNVFFFFESLLYPAVVGFTASIKDIKLSYSSFAQPLFFQLNQSSVLLHNAATAATVAAQQMGGNKCPAAQAALELKRWNPDN